jgi:superfamily II DNA or RNA helicase
MSSLSLANQPRVLTHMGYAIRKDSLTAEQLSKLRKDLMVAPKIAGRFQKQAEPFPVFLESANRIYAPRIWATEQFGEPCANILVEGEPLRETLRFEGTPYDYQTAIVQQFLDAGGNGLICVPCGRGKTFMAINIAARLGKRFMVVVDKEFLLQQWAGELKSLLPGIRIGILQENKKQIGPEYDCTIAMIQTLVQRDFAETDFRPFGFTIFDECHHLGAAHFSRSLLKVQTKWMLGLSATPTRDDGLTKVFEWFLGKPVYWEKTREADPEVIVRRVDFDCDDTSYSEVPTDPRLGDVILARLLTQIVDCEERNQKIDELLGELLKDSRRRILVLSERKGHLQRIEAGLPKGTTCGYYIGGMKEEVREEGAKTAQVLLGTYAMASEAMNIKALNTMIMASPRKKIEQSTGRILRTRKDQREVQPMILDIVDSHDVYQGQWGKRKAYYKKCEYTIEAQKADGSWEKEKVGRAKKKEQEEVKLMLVEED